MTINISSNSSDSLESYSSQEHLYAFSSHEATARGSEFDLGYLFGLFSKHVYLVGMLFARLRDIPFFG